MSDEVITGQVPIFSDAPHKCDTDTPFAAMPKQAGWAGYWTCPVCRTEYRMERNWFGTASAQKMTR